MAASQSTPDYVLTYNCNGKGTADEKRGLVLDIFHKYNPPVVFFQQITSGQKLHDLLTDNSDEDENDYSLFINGPEVGICIDTHRVVNLEKDYDVKVSSPIVRSTHEELLTNLQIFEPVDFNRLCMKVVRFKDKKSPVLLASLHGQHNKVTTTEKQDLFYNLLVFLKQLLADIGVDYLICGGGFNLQIQYAQDVFDKYPNVADFFTVHHVGGTLDRKSSVDYFVTSREVQLDSCRPLNYSKYAKKKYPGGTKVAIAHHPIGGFVNICLDSDRSGERCGALGGRKDKSSERTTKGRPQQEVKPKTTYSTDVKRKDLLTGTMKSKTSHHEVPESIRQEKEALQKKRQYSKKKKELFK